MMNKKAVNIEATNSLPMRHQTDCWKNWNIKSYIIYFKGSKTQKSQQFLFLNCSTIYQVSKTFF